MSLSSIYTELHRRARESQSDRALDLKGGARLAVRVVHGVTTLTISRKMKRLSDTEITVFKRDLGIPSHAIRYPADGQGMKEREGATWHFVAFRFEDES